MQNLSVGDFFLHSLNPLPLSRVTLRVLEQVVIPNSSKGCQYEGYYILLRRGSRICSQSRMFMSSSSDRDQQDRSCLERYSRISPLTQGSQKQATISYLRFIFKFKHFVLIINPCVYKFYSFSQVKYLIETHIYMGNTCCQENLAYFHFPSVIRQSQYQSDSEILQKTSEMNIIQFIKEHNLSCWKHHTYDLYYCGNWYEGKADGVGLSYVPKSYVYEGSFEEGLLNGGGTLTYLKHHRVYDGNFLSGKAHGKGKYINKEQSYIVLGEWFYSQLKNGKIVFQNDQMIKSIEFQEKRGIITYHNGSKYEGEMNNSFVPDGKGKLTYDSSSSNQGYIGDWVDGKYHGKGTFKWRDKSQYSGEYIFGKKQGYGTFIYKNHNIYKGHWLNGKQHGRGILYNERFEQIKMGIWRNGKLQLKFLSNQLQIIEDKLVSKTSLRFQ